MNTHTRAPVHAGSVRLKPTKKVPLKKTLLEAAPHKKPLQKEGDLSSTPRTLTTYRDRRQASSWHYLPTTPPFIYAAQQNTISALTFKGLSMSWLDGSKTRGSRGAFLVGFSPTLQTRTGARMCGRHVLPPPRRKRGNIYIGETRFTSRRRLRFFRGPRIVDEIVFWHYNATSLPLFNLALNRIHIFKLHARASSAMRSAALCVVTSLPGPSAPSD
ncbi:hypothetical protein EVAR_93115_1 [Eumeta japonica]|uniref:Uncharacterized protein n=1 Tax=Eumeta variegata TaxID=151549 RepID=A0A4C1TFA2_EUMVA|nr:hypothetical protein EVAR_93115_1 [Eumeta japonica]